jgi:hypothetical protein
MTYWLVIGIAFLALVGVFFVAVTGVEEEKSKPRATGRPIWVLLGSSGRPSGDRSDQRDWAELLTSHFPRSIDIVDLTQNGCTAAELQREQLRRARDRRPRVAVLLIGPDDFRDALPLPEFSRRFQYIVASLAGTGARVIVSYLPPMSSLPSLVDDDPRETAEDVDRWNRELGEIIENANGIGVGLPLEAGVPPETFFTESDGRFILTPAGHEWLASSFFAVLQPIAASYEGSS